MRPEQWQHFKAAAKRIPGTPVPLSLIVDSPWIPGHLGITHKDYYFNYRRPLFLTRALSICQTIKTVVLALTLTLTTYLDAGTDYLNHAFK